VKIEGVFYPADIKGSPMDMRQIDQYMWDPEIIGKKMLFLSGPRQVGRTSAQPRPCS
jgi:hypothetical protein